MLSWNFSMTPSSSLYDRTADEYPELTDRVFVSKRRRVITENYREQTPESPQYYGVDTDPRSPTYSSLRETSSFIEHDDDVIIVEPDASEATRDRDTNDRSYRQRRDSNEERHMQNEHVEGYRPQIEPGNYLESRASGAVVVEDKEGICGFEYRLRKMESIPVTKSVTVETRRRSVEEVDSNYDRRNRRPDQAPEFREDRHQRNGIRNEDDYRANTATPNTRNHFGRNHTQRDLISKSNSKEKTKKSDRRESRDRSCRNSRVHVNRDERHQSQTRDRSRDRHDSRRRLEGGDDYRRGRDSRHCHHDKVVSYRDAKEAGTAESHYVKVDFPGMEEARKEVLKKIPLLRRIASGEEPLINYSAPIKAPPLPDGQEKEIYAFFDDFKSVVKITIDEIREKSNCKLEILEKKNKRREFRQIEMIGTAEEIREAKKLFDEQIIYRREQEIEENDVASRSLGGKGTVTLAMHVPDKWARSVFKNRHSMLKNIERRFSVEITRIVYEVNFLKMNGRPDKVRQAKIEFDDQIEEIKKEISKFHRNDMPDRDVDTGIFELEVEDRYIGRLIGPKGKEIQRIRKESEAKCHLGSRDLHGTMKVVVSGEKTSAEYARHLILVQIGKKDRNARFEPSGEGNLAKVQESSSRRKNYDDVICI